MCHTADSKPVKQEVNGTVILLPLVLHGQSNISSKVLSFFITFKGVKKFFACK